MIYESCPDGCNSPLAAATARGRRAAILTLVKAVADVNLSLPTHPTGNALSAAAASNQEDSVKLLIELGADVNVPLASEYGSALATAASWAGTEAMSNLVGAGADVNLAIHRNIPAR